jgi:hypothetical protein
MVGCCAEQCTLGGGGCGWIDESVSVRIEGGQNADNVLQCPGRFGASGLRVCSMSMGKIGASTWMFHV